MYKSLLAFLVFLITGTLVQAQVPHYPLVEEFTQASCGPCAQQNPDFNQLLSNNAGSVISIKYQTSWPGIDPMNADNPDEVAVRRDYYMIQGVPTAIMDGTFWPTGRAYKGAPYNLTQNNLNTAMNKTSPVSVKVTHSIDSLFNTLDVEVVLKNETQSSFSVSNQKLFVAIVEREISWPFAPGSNGEKEFSNVMRKFLPDVNGTSLKAMPAGHSETYSFSVTPPKYIHDVSELKIIAWVQNKSTKVITQAGESTPTDASHFALPNLATEAEAFTPANKCDHEITPKCTVLNVGKYDVTGALVGYSLNGGRNFTVKQLNMNLAAGEKVEVEFDPVQAGSGYINLVYSTSVPSSLGKREKNNLDNIVVAPSFVLYEENAFAEETEFDFEIAVPDLPTIPNHIIVEANHLLANSVVGPKQFGLDPIVNIGAYGQSKQCFIFFYRALPPGSENYVTIQKMDFSRAVHAELSFDWCMGTPNQNNNSLELLYSTDCGETWTSIWKETGSKLKTADAPTSGLFLPHPSRWVNKKIDISSVAGEAEVLLRFNYVSSGDGVSIGYMDNLKVKRTQTVATKAPEELPLLSTVQISPNPVRDQMTLSFALQKPNKVSISVYDAEGRKVQMPVASSVFDAGHHTVNWHRTGEAPGNYVLKLVTADKTIIKRFVIVE